MLMIHSRWLRMAGRVAVIGLVLGGGPLVAPRAGDGAERVAALDRH